MRAEANSLSARWEYLMDQAVPHVSFQVIHAALLIRPFTASLRPVHVALKALYLLLYCLLALLLDVLALLQEEGHILRMKFVGRRQDRALEVGAALARDSRDSDRAQVSVELLHGQAHGL